MGVGEGNGQLNRVRHVEIYGSCVRGCSSPETTYYFLSFVLVVDVWGYYLLVCVVGFWYVEGIEAEGCQIVGEVGKSWVIVLLNFWLAVVIYGFLHHFDSGGGPR